MKNKNLTKSGLSEYSIVLYLYNFVIPEICLEKQLNMGNSKPYN